MAILPDVPGFAVDVLVNGHVAIEYEAGDENVPQPGHLVDKYIESKTGATFAIRLTFDRTFDWILGLVIAVYIDGKKSTGIIIGPEAYADRDYSTIIEGSRFSRGEHWYLQKFKFSELVTDDGELRGMSQDQKDSIKSLGYISVKVLRVKAATNTYDSPSKDQKIGASSGAVPEKALKGRAISHKTGFEQPQSIKNVKTRNCEYLDSETKPFGMCNFRYRSRAALQAEMIIPRSPSPVPPKERDINELSVDEMRELLRQQRVRDAGQIQLKREKREHSTMVDDYSFDGDGLEVTDERSSKSRRTNESIETVDLTGM